MSSIRPLPCPFCGSIPEAGVAPSKDSDRDYGKTERGYVCCINYACAIRPKVATIMPAERGKESAISLWNIRP